MKWYKIIKILIEFLSFGLLTYERFNKEKDSDEESNRNPDQSV